MMQCQIRVITNGYILSYMDGNDLMEVCFDDREELFCYLGQNLSLAIWEEMA